VRSSVGKCDRAQVYNALDCRCEIDLAKVRLLAAHMLECKCGAIDRTGKE
jgi:hypothetical protein